MTYKLLTGATGLLGRYLLRDLLLHDFRVAVLVRPNRHQTAEERVDSLLAPWEEEWGRCLPRPVVLTGDMTHPLLGLGTDQRRWLRAHCDSVLHSAASLTFHEKDGEPWNTNVEGVRRLLELCRDVDIRVVEQVSSSYVCGLRTGTVFESELDVGQEFGNDYEKSKVVSEQLIREDSFLEKYTVFRPSIITGDSRSGFTSTFHGFYTPLRLMHAMLAQLSCEEIFEADYLQLLGLQGDEGKNFVPVDWVSDAIVSILSRTSPRDEIYGLASPHAVSVSRLLASFEKSLRAFAKGQAMQGGHSRSGPVEQQYFEQLSVYQSYWRNDPDFDCSNSHAVLPDKRCPEFTDEMLQLMCDYAIDSNFGWPQPRFTSSPFSTRSRIARQVGYGAPRSKTDAQESLGLTVTGVGGGSWTLHFDRDSQVTCSEGLCDTDAQVRMAWHTFRDIETGEVSVNHAMSQGRLVAYGDRRGIQQFQSLIEALE